MKTLQALLVALLFLACSHEMPTKQNGETPLPQWAMFGKNLRHTSNAADVVEYYAGPQGGQIIWTLAFGVSELSLTSPSIGPDGTIYTSTTPIRAIDDTVGFVYAINPSGAIKWRFKTQRGNGATGAVGVDGTYYVSSGDRYFYAIGREGNLRWKRSLQSYFGQSYFGTERPAISQQGEIILPVYSGILSLDKDTGEISWFYETTTLSASGVSIDKNGNIFVGTVSEVLALSSEGSKRWGFPVPSPGPREVVIAHDGTILFAIPGDSLIYSLSPEGRLQWTFNLMGRARDNVLGFAPDGAIVTMNAAIRPQTIYKVNPAGQMIWAVEIVQLVGRHGVSLTNSSPIIDQQGNIYLAIGRTGSNNFYALKQDGELKWAITIEDPSVSISAIPAIASDGTMYVVGDHSINAIR
jgi:hypothetical protein